MDSDHHQIQTARGVYINPPQKVFIHDHVWLTGNIRIHANADIGCNSIIGPFCVINEKIPMCSSVSAYGELNLNSFAGRWSSASNNIVRKDVNSKGKYRQILVGYGKEGKEYYKKQKDYVDFIIDNNSKDKDVVSFKEFLIDKKNIDSNYLFVIGSTKYCEELTKMIRKEYPKANIVLHSEIIHNSK
jgi:hypothetical protein